VQAVSVDYLSTLVGRSEAVRLLANAGLEHHDHIDLPAFWRLCAENIQRLNDESHGVAAEPVPRGSLSLLYTSAKEADTLQEALKRFTETARLIRKECRVTLRNSKDAVHLTILPASQSDARAEIYGECFAVVTHCAFRWMTGRRLDPLRVRGSAILRALDGDAMLGSLHAPLTRSGSGVTIVYDIADVGAAILSKKYKAWGDHEFESFQAMLEESGSPHDAAMPIVLAVRALLQKGLRSESGVADAFHWSVATLRRHLSGEGASFRHLSTELRRDQLRDLLATDIAIVDITDKMGFSDERSLRRFCSDNFGVSPRGYRQLLRDGRTKTAA
jgi:AraC-like DNA-binding protein